MKKRLFLYWVNIHRDDLAVYQTVECAGAVFPDCAETPPVVVDEAVMAAEMTPNIIIVQLFVDHRLFHIFIISGRA